MRISTNVLYDSGAGRLSDLQSSLLKTQEQLSSGRKVLTPSDDPIAAAQALEFTQAQAANTQYKTNRQDARDALSQEESVLNSVTTLLQNAKTLVVSAGNGSLDDTQRGYIATELSGQLSDLISLANTKDGAGNYLFSGFQSSVQPFSPSANGAQYSGDQGQRLLQASSARQIAVNDTGNAVFEQINGYKTIGTAAASANTGTGTVSTAAVSDASLLTGHNYDIDFSVGGSTTYNVYDITLDPTKSGAPLATGAYNASGTPISFDGMQVTVSGAPANNDSFQLRAGAKQSVFQTLNDLVNLLKTPTTTAASKTNLAHGLDIANGNLDNALDNVLTVRASAGSRLKELDSLDDLGSDLDLQYSSSLSQLQDLDYTAAITTYSKQKTTLEAAQQSFVQTTSLSLFKYL